MNTGAILTRALKRLNLSVSDFGMRTMALEYLNEIVQEHWSARKFDAKISRFSITSIGNTEEYALHKYVDQIVPYTMRGTDPVRRIDYVPTSAFFKKYTYDLESGSPTKYRDGEFFGVQAQPSAASQITAVSSLANVTTGTVAVIYGSPRMTLSTLTLTADDIGKWIAVGTDWKRYQIISLEPALAGTSSVFYVHEPYDGTTNATATFNIGDVQQRVNIQGLDANGVMIEEDLQLNGATTKTSSKYFSSLMRITKTDKTHGRITCQSNSGTINNIILDPAETELDFKTVKFYPIPNAVERIEYEAYTKHPQLYRNTDSPLFPSQWHQIFVMELYCRIASEFLGRELPMEIQRRREKMLDDFLVRTNDADGWHVVAEYEAETLRTTNNNLPAEFDADDGHF